MEPALCFRHVIKRQHHDLQSTIASPFENLVLRVKMENRRNYMDKTCTDFCERFWNHRWAATERKVDQPMAKYVNGNDRTLSDIKWKSVKFSTAQWMEGFWKYFPTELCPDGCSTEGNSSIWVQHNMAENGILLLSCFSLKNSCSSISIIAWF